ncbi:LysR family transcriptional regulator [Aquabacterium sp. OR-4]|uniref:LysR family transcriptional regulator n=1 Tax=Aquabacterium sp. OR-4 TaxID=2978127 RepID=UPI0021B3EF1D|nr:LysR family transcriptional regulator [Aquabacterium sp. OR-4]MDT7835422.1 LysR family transcriptional regulator [Aquabacterium sp. OR-4]
MESLRGMVSFVHTARGGSFARAAEALGVSAVAVSRNVARLEAQLGVRLFARTTRQLSLSAEGAALLAECEAPLASLDAAFQNLRGGVAAATGTVRVTAVSPYVRGYLAAGLADFHARHPQVVLDIECSEQVSDLVAARFDVGIRIGPLRDAGYVARPLGPLALVLCASPGFAARPDLPDELPELARRHGLGLKPAGDSQAAPWWLQRDGGVQPLVVGGPLVCNDFSTLIAACAAGLGVAQVPLVAALPQLRAGALRVLHPHCAPRGLQLFLHYPDRQLPTRVRVFVDFVLGTAHSHPDLALLPEQFAALAPA